MENFIFLYYGLKVEPLDTTDGYKVSGRGELHLSILIENMRREGYELGVSKPEVLMHRDENGTLLEPMERVIVNCPEVYSGTIINELNQRKGMMESMEMENCPEVYSGTIINELNQRKGMMESMEMEGDYVKIEFIAPTRGLLGYRSEFINVTRGEGTLVRSFERFEEHKGEIPGRSNGVLISQGPGTTMGYALNAINVTRGEGTLVRSFERFEEHKGEIPGRSNGVLISQGPGTTMGYALNALSERATMFVDPGVEV